MEITTELLTLCDFALTSREGKLSVLGLFDRFFVSEVPSKYARFFLVAIISGTPNSEHSVNLKVTTPSSNDLLPLKPVKLTFGPNGKANLITDLANITLPEIGEYKISLSSDSKSLAERSFFVTQISKKDTNTNQLPN